MNLKENKRDYMERLLGREGGIDIIVSSFPNNNKTQKLGHWESSAGKSFAADLISLMTSIQYLQRL